MSVYLLLIMSVLVLGTLSRGWKQHWLARQQNKGVNGVPAADETQNAVARVTTGVKAWITPVWTQSAQKVSGLRNSLDFHAHQADRAQRFRAWAITALAEDEKVVRWLTALSPAANLAFTEQVAEFCHVMGFELTALIDGELKQLPTAEQKAREIVLLYCRTNRQAAFAQSEFDASKRLLAYLRAPTQRSNHRFGQNLYRKLTAHGLAAKPPFDVTQATEVELHTQMLTTIRQVAAQQPDVFTTVLNEMVAEIE